MFLTIIFSLAALIVLFPCLVLLGECLGTLLPTQSTVMGRRPTSIVVLIPPHNEAEVIASTLEGIIPQLAATDSLVVVADNCSDATAEIARTKGARVLERFDAEKKGKGYALAYGVRSLADQPPEVVVLVDADCHLGEKALSLLATQALLTQKPVQGRYLMQSPAKPSIKDLLSSFAFLVKNWVRPLGLKNLGFPCLLTGAGMAFPWSVLENAPLASGNIVEDMQLGLDLAIAGYPTQFCPEATILSRLPQGSDGATKQRTRWEHGHLKTLVEQCPRLLQAAWQQRRLDLLILAAELSVPPLSFLVLLWLGMISLVLLLTVAQGITLLPLLLLILAGLFLIVSIGLAWAGFARSWLPLTTLLLIPLYLLWKIPLYFAFLLRPQTEWVRTARDQDQKLTDS